MNFILACPICRAALCTEPQGARCATHGLYAMDAGGFLRFLGNDSNYFSGHWSQHQVPEVPPSKLEAARTFLAPLVERLPSGTVVDVGTGDGIHLHYLKQAAPALSCAGLDISDTGLATTHLRSPDAALFHADAQAIPLADASVDATFSYGVLAYLPKPWQGLAEMVRVTKPGGYIGIWMYPKRSGIVGTLFTLTRAVVKRLPGFLQRRVADMLVPFLGFMPTNSDVRLGNASWAACREVVLVNIAPPHLIFPTRDTMVAQLNALGCTIIAENEDTPVTLWAVKGGA